MHRLFVSDPFEKAMQFRLSRSSPELPVKPAMARRMLQHFRSIYAAGNWLFCLPRLAFKLISS